MQIIVVGPADLPELLPLMRAYCNFYQLAPEDQALLEQSQALLADPQREGLQLVAADARGTGVADGLIAACLERCREHGATQLVWQTASDNHRAQAVYERVGPPARTAGWTTSCWSIPSDLSPRDGPPTS